MITRRASFDFFGKGLRERKKRLKTSPRSEALLHTYILVSLLQLHYTTRDPESWVWRDVCHVVRFAMYVCMYVCRLCMYARDTQDAVTRYVYCKWLLDEDKTI